MKSDLDENLVEIDPTSPPDLSTQPRTFRKNKKTNIDEINISKNPKRKK